MDIFRAYDIRGSYPSQLNEEIAYKIGRAFVAFLNAKNVLVGRDCRLSSPELHKSLINGILDQGADVIDIGLTDINAFYYAVYKLKAESGIMITGSHNPKEDNGFKLVKEKSIPISDQNGILDIKSLVERNKFDSRNKEGGKKKGKLKSKKNIHKDFLKTILNYVDYKTIAPLKVVLDPGNGTAQIILDELIKKLKCSFIKMNFKIDGNFPGRGANPWINHNAVTEAVKNEKADLGIAWDGDADRIFFIDEKGKFIPGDFITGLLSKIILKNPAETPFSIVYDLRSSHYVKDTIKKNNGNPVICKVGHSFIKHMMRNNKAVFAGEVSGHYYFKYEDLYCENSFFVFLNILKIMSQEKKKISELLEDTKGYFISGEISSEVEDKEHVLRKLEMKYRDGKINKLDGITVEYSDWWFNVRPSNTESLIRLNLEANSKELMEKKEKEVLAVIRS